MLTAELKFHGQLPFVFLGLPVSVDGALLPLLNSHQLPHYLIATFTLAYSHSYVNEVAYH